MNPLNEKVRILKHGICLFERNKSESKSQEEKLFWDKQIYLANIELNNTLEALIE